MSLNFDDAKDDGDLFLIEHACCWVLNQFSCHLHLLIERKIGVKVSDAFLKIGLLSVHHFYWIKLASLCSLANGCCKGVSVIDLHRE